MLLCFPAYIIAGYGRTVKKGFTIIGKDLFYIVGQVIKVDPDLIMLSPIFLCYEFGKWCLIIFTIKGNSECFQCGVIFFGNGRYQSTINASAQKGTHFKIR